MDPPWSYSLRKSDKTHRNRIPYESMTIEKILELPIPSLAASDCVLWLWYTNNHVLEAGDCLRHWGFTLKTILTWEKVTKTGNPRIGVGHWLRNCTEHCFLAVRGKPKSFRGKGLLTNQSTVIRAERREHSRKPEQFYQMVEHLCPGSKLEMFSRQRRDGWHHYGDQVDMFSA